MLEIFPASTFCTALRYKFKSHLLQFRIFCVARLIFHVLTSCQVLLVAPVPNASKVHLVAPVPNASMALLVAPVPNASKVLLVAPVPNAKCFELPHSWKL